MVFMYCIPVLLNRKLWYSYTAKQKVKGVTVLLNRKLRVLLNC